MNHPMYQIFATKMIQMGLIVVLRNNQSTVIRHLNRITVTMEISLILATKMLKHIIKNSHQETRVGKNLTVWVENYHILIERVLIDSIESNFTLSTFS